MARSPRRVASIVLPELACELVAQMGQWAHRGPLENQEPSPFAIESNGGRRIGEGGALPSCPMVVCFEHERASTKKDGAASLSGKRSFRAERTSVATVGAGNLAARRRGIRVGQRITEAAALCAGLVVRTLPFASLYQALASLAEIAMAYGSVVAIDDARTGSEVDTIWVDITGAAHLFGGERALALSLMERFVEAGHVPSVVIADGPRLGQALARGYYAQRRFQVEASASESSLPQRLSVAEVVASGEGQATLGRFPLSALRLSSEAQRFLFHIGAVTIADFVRLPKAELLHRVASIDKQTASVTLSLLELARGVDTMPLRPFVPAEQPNERLDFEEGVESTEPLLFVASGMVSRLASILEGRQEGCARLDVHIGLDKSIARLRGCDDELCLALELPAPLSRADDLLRALRAKLETTRLPAPALSFTLTLARCAPLTGAQLDLSRDVAIDPDALPTLLAELSAEIGPERFGVLVLGDSHLPEKRSSLAGAVSTVLSNGQSQVRRTSDHSAELNHVDGHGHRSTVAWVPTRLLEAPVPLQIVGSPESPSTQKRGALRGGVEVDMVGQRYHVLRTRFTHRLRGIEWWSESATSRDYAQLWLTDAQGEVSCAAVFRDAERGGYFVHGWWE